ASWPRVRRAWFFRDDPVDLGDLHPFPTRRSSDLGAAAAAAALGYHVVLIDDPVVGEARAAALACVRDATARANAVARPSCIVSRDRKSTRLNSSHDQISYAVFCLKKKKAIAATDN